MMKHILRPAILSLSLLALAACGGGGGSDNDSPPPVKTVAQLKVNLSGDPGGKGIAGVGFTLTLPTDVTPATDNGAVAVGVVMNSGTFADSTMAPIVTYTPAGAAPGKLQIVLSSSAVSGVTTAGEVATVTLQLSNSATPTAADFPVTDVDVIDTSGAPLAAMTAAVAAVTVQ